MAKKLTFDDGLIRLDVNGNGVLCFAPSDINLYQRFCAFVNGLSELERKYQQVETPSPDQDPLQSATAILDKAREVDVAIKRELSAVFGGADFDQLLGGVNVMSWASNGERVITNFLAAIQPYLEEGVGKYLTTAAAGPVKAAKTRRAKRLQQG